MPDLFEESELLHPMPSLQHFCLSNRIPNDLEPTALSEATDSRSTHTLDLMQSNPTCVGISYPQLPQLTLGPETWSYEPDPFGLQSTRESLSDYLQQHGACVHPESMLLTSSTSEAYSMLFKLLCNPGERIAKALPSYPLVAHLAALEGVETVDYFWVQKGRHFELDLHSVERAVRMPGVRALVVIEPHSPLGCSMDAETAHAVAQICAAADVVLIVDAVFARYRRDADAETTAQNFARVHPAWCANDAKVLVMSGLSKLGLLPQLKLGWITWHGNKAFQKQIRQGLEWIADAYLSVNTPVQKLVPKLLPHLPELQTQICQRLSENMALLEKTFSDISSIRTLASPGGWYAILQAQAEACDEDELVYYLFEKASVALHPGYFYDFARSGFWVVGLLLQRPRFGEAMMRIATHLPHFSPKYR